MPSGRWRTRRSASWAPPAVMIVAAQDLPLGDQAAEVTGRPLVTRGAGNRKHPLGRHPALGLRDSFGDQLGHRILLVGPLAWRWCGIAGLKLVDDFLDGPMGGAAQLRRSPVRPELLIGRNDVHAVPRRLQWNSPVVAVCGWHLHRRHRGPQFLIDTTNTGWILLSGQNWIPLLGHQWVLFHGHGHSWTRSSPRCRSRSSSAATAQGGLGGRGGTHRGLLLCRPSTGQPDRRKELADWTGLVEAEHGPKRGVDGPQVGML